MCYALVSAYSYQSNSATAAFGYPLLLAYIMNASPAIDAMRAVHAWFAREQPALAGKLLNYLILHPVPQALMAYAGEDVLAAHQREFML